MSVVAVDGFDTFNGTGANTGIQAVWIPNNGVSSCSLVSGRFGGQAFSISNAGTTERMFRRNLPSSQASGSEDFAFKIASLPNADVLCLAAVYDSTTPQCQIGLTVDGKLRAYRCGSTGVTSSLTILGTSAAQCIFANTWHYIEWEWSINDTTGAITIKVDGVAVLTLTNQDTKQTTNAYATHVAIGQGSTGNLLGVANLFDDFYVTDGAALGERRVETIYPSADVAQGFARSTGTANYALVDEAQVNGDTDYVQGSTVGDVDTYDFGNLTSTPTAIDAVQVTAYALKTDAGTRTFALQVKSGATTSDGSAFGLNASYAKFERLLTTDPATSASWTASAVNALRGGPKVIS